MQGPELIGPIGGLKLESPGAIRAQMFSNGLVPWRNDDGLVEFVTLILSDNCDGKRAKTKRGFWTNTSFLQEGHTTFSSFLQRNTIQGDPIKISVVSINAAFGL